MEQAVIGMMEGMLQISKVCYPEINEDRMRQTIVAANLKAIVEIILFGDDPNNPVTTDIKQICLALLATADWLDPEEVKDAHSGNA